MAESDGEALTAFGATCINHSAATPSRHAGAKTVGSGAVNDAGLVCSFHAKNSYRKTSVPNCAKTKNSTNVIPQNQRDKPNVKSDRTRYAKRPNIRLKKWTDVNQESTLNQWLPRFGVMLRGLKLRTGKAALRPVSVIH